MRWSSAQHVQAATAEGADPQADAAFRKDANDVLLSDGKEALLQCIEAAEPYPIRGLFRWAPWQPGLAMWGETCGEECGHEQQWQQVATGLVLIQLCHFKMLSCLLIECLCKVVPQQPVHLVKLQVFRVQR